MEPKSCEAQSFGGRRKGKSRQTRNDANQQRKNKNGGAAAITVRDAEIVKNSCSAGNLDENRQTVVADESEHVSILNTASAAEIVELEESDTTHEKQKGTEQNNSIGSTEDCVDEQCSVAPLNDEEAVLTKSTATVSNSSNISQDLSSQSEPLLRKIEPTLSGMIKREEAANIHLDPVAFQADSIETNSSSMSQSNSSKHRRVRRDVCNSPRAEDERQDHVAMYPTLHQPHEVMLDPYPSMRIRSACVVEGRLVTCHKNGLRFFESYWTVDSSSSDGTPTHPRSKSGKSSPKYAAKEKPSSSNTGQLISMSSVTNIAFSGWKQFLPSAVLHQLSGAVSSSSASNGGGGGMNYRDTTANNSPRSSQYGGLQRKPTLYNNKTAGNLFWKMIAHRDDFDLMDSYMCVSAPQVYLDYDGSSVDCGKTTVDESGEVHHSYRRYVAVASGSDRTLHSVCVVAYGSNFLLHHELHRKNRVTAMGLFTVALEPFHESRLTAFVVSVDEVGEVVIFDVEKNRAHRLMAVDDISTRNAAPRNGSYDYTLSASFTSDFSQLTAPPVEDDVVEDDNTPVNVVDSEEGRSPASPNRVEVPRPRMARVYPYRLSSGVATRVSLVGPCLELCNRCHNSNDSADSESALTGVCRMTLYISSGSYDEEGKSELNVTSIRLRLSRNGNATYADGVKAQQQASATHGRFLEAFSVPFRSPNSYSNSSASTTGNGRGRSNSSFVKRTLNGGSLTMPIQPRRMSEEDAIVIPWVETSDLFPTAGIISDEIVVREAAPENVCSGTGVAMLAVPYRISRPNVVLLARPRLRFWVLSGCTGTLMNLRRVYAENAPRTSVHPSADGSGSAQKKISHHAMNALRQSYCALDNNTNTTSGNSNNPPLRTSCCPPSSKTFVSKPSNPNLVADVPVSHDAMTKSTFSTRSVREFSLELVCIGRHALSSDPETTWMLSVVLTNGGAVLLLGRSPIHVDDSEEDSSHSHSDSSSNVELKCTLEHKNKGSEHSRQPVKNSSVVRRDSSVLEKNGTGELEQWLEDVVHTPVQPESDKDTSFGCDTQMAVPIPLVSVHDRKKGGEGALSSNQTTGIQSRVGGRLDVTQRRRRGTRKTKDNPESSIGPIISKNNGNFVDETNDYTVLLHLFSSTHRNLSGTLASEGLAQERTSSSRSSSTSRRRRRSRGGRSRQAKSGGTHEDSGAAVASALSVECLLPVPKRHCVLMLMDDLRTVLCTTLPLAPTSTGASTKQTEEASTRTSRIHREHSITPPRSERQALTDTPKDEIMASTLHVSMATVADTPEGPKSHVPAHTEGFNLSQQSSPPASQNTSTASENQKPAANKDNQQPPSLPLKPGDRAAAKDTATRSLAHPPLPPNPANPSKGKDSNAFGWFKNVSSIYDMNITRPLASAVLTALGGDTEDVVPQAGAGRSSTSFESKDERTRRVSEPTTSSANVSQPHVSTMSYSPQNTKKRDTDPFVSDSPDVRVQRSPKRRLQSSSPTGTHATTASTSSTRRSIDDSVSTCSTTAASRGASSMQAMSIKLESFDKQQSRRRRTNRKNPPQSPDTAHALTGDFPLRSISPRLPHRSANDEARVTATESAALVEYATRQASIAQEQMKSRSGRRKKVPTVTIAGLEARESSQTGETKLSEGGDNEDEDEQENSVNDRYMQVLEVMRLLERIDDAEEPNAREALAFQEMKDRSILLMRFLDEREEAHQTELARKQSLVAAANADAAVREYGSPASPTLAGFALASPSQAVPTNAYHRTIRNDHSRYHELCSFHSVEDQMLEVTGSARFATVFRESTSFTTLTRGAPRSAAFSLPRHFEFSTYFETLRVPATLQNLQEGDRCKFEIEDLVVAHRRNIGSLSEYLVITITQNQIREGWKSQLGSSSITATEDGTDGKRGGHMGGRPGKWVQDPTFPYEIEGGESMDIGRVNRQPGMYAGVTLEIMKRNVSGVSRGVSGSREAVSLSDVDQSTADGSKALNQLTAVSLLSSMGKLSHGTHAKPCVWRWATPMESEKWKDGLQIQVLIDAGLAKDPHMKSRTAAASSPTSNRSNVPLSSSSPVGLPSSVRKPFRSDTLPKELEGWEVGEWMYAPRWPNSEEADAEKRRKRAKETLATSARLDDEHGNAEYKDDSDVEIENEESISTDVAQRRGMKKMTKEDKMNSTFWSNSESKDANVRCRQLTRLCVNCDVEQLKQALTIRHQRELEGLRRELGL